MSEPLRLKEIREFDEARYRPHCIDPERGLYDVLDTCNGGGTTLETGLKWYEALSKVRELNKDTPKMVHRGRTYKQKK